MEATALKLAQLGFKVFALNPGGKPWGNCDECKASCEDAEDYEACPCLTCHACYAGTDDPDKISQMWFFYPDSLIGIRTGAVSGVFVLDFDTHAAHKDGLATYKEGRIVRAGNPPRFPDTVTALTGGGGLHLYYLHPGFNSRIMNNNRGLIGPGCDVKGDGGYVIAPPSRKEGKSRAYVWEKGLSPWDRSIADASEAVRSSLVIDLQAPATFRNADSVLNVDFAELTAISLKQALEELDWATMGSRNDTLYRASCRAGEAVAAGKFSFPTATQILTEAGSSTGLTNNEVRDTVRSGLNRGMHDYDPEVHDE